MTLVKSEEKLRKLANQRGLDWNKMPEDKRVKNLWMIYCMSSRL